MRKTLLLLLFTGISQWLGAQTPANDSCTQAIDISLGGSISFSTANANTDGPLHLNSPCPSSSNDSLFSDIWYRYTATTSGLVDWTLCGTADFDTKIAVYKGGAICPLTDDDLLTCNDDFGTCIGNTSRLIFQAEAGQSYLLRLGGWGETAPGETGSGTFTLQAFTSAVPNDFCAQAIPISFVEDYPFTNVDATTDGPLQPNNSACFGFGDPNVQGDVWYSFTAPVTGTVEWSTCDQINFDSRLAVYGPDVSCTPTGDQLYACNDDGSGCSNYTSRVVFDVQEGETYLLRLGGYAGEQGLGTFDLVEIVPPVPPANDLCTSPDSAWIVTADQADDFDNPILGTTVNGTFDQDNFLYPNAQCFGTNTAGGEFSDVWYWFNTYGNEQLEMRLFKGNESPSASFYLEMFNACDMQVDTNVLFGSCIYLDEATAAGGTIVTGLPAEPTLYLLRVTTRLTTQLPGDFFLFIIGEITEPPVGVVEVFPGTTLVSPNPAGDRLGLQLMLEQPSVTSIQVFNPLGQQVMREDLGKLGSGPHHFNFDIGKLSAGVYHLLTRDADTGAVQMIKFLKTGR
ncbi:MAG: hypothetical protein RI973_1072 [Bacteroidota bacterium]|jgi:hypothetical protein